MKGVKVVEQWVVIKKKEETLADKEKTEWILRSDLWSVVYCDYFFWD
jgi:hypothetical protein